MDYELARAGSKLSREQKARGEAQKRKAERDRRAKEAAKKKQEEIAAELEARRLEQMEAERVAEEQRYEDLMKNNGVAFVRPGLVPVLCEPGADKGIVRRADKILLPPSARSELQEAQKNGAMFFELSCGPLRSHGQVLDFTADEGTLGLPPRLFKALAGPSAQPNPRVTARYVKLPKGTFARLQPRGADFQKEVDDIKLVLEAVLHRYATLTVGDVVSVDVADKTHELRVLELQPESAVSVIETDLEVDIAPSVENEEAVAAAEAEEAKRWAEAQRVAEEEARRKAEATRLVAEEEARRAAAEAERERWRVAKASTLPPEPAAAEPNLVTVMVRMPDGSRCSRRYQKADPLQLLYDAVEAHTGLEPGRYQLVRTLPREVFSPQDNAEATLQTVGLVCRQEALMMEVL